MASYSPNSKVPSDRSLRALANARIAVEEDPVRLELERRRARPSGLFAAMMLSPSLEICEALLRGEPVPLERLDQKWAERYGLREGPS